MFEDTGNVSLAPKEYGSLTLKAGRIYYLFQQQEVQDVWNLVVSAICAFEDMHTKEGWEYVLLNRRDIEDIAEVFEHSNSPEEFRDGILKLKERELAKRLGEY